MFSRIHYAAHVLSSRTTRVPAHETPDIVFRAEGHREISWASKAVSKLIEVVVVMFTVGYLSSIMFDHLFARKYASVGFAATVGSVGTFIFIQLYDRIRERFVAGLRISERIAPYFGRRITRSYRILRG